MNGPKATNDKDEPLSRTTCPSRSVNQKRRCLRVMTLTAMKCPLSEPVSRMVSMPLFSVSYATEPNSKACYPPETKLGPSMQGSPSRLKIAAAASLTVLLSLSNVVVRRQDALGYLRALPCQAPRNALTPTLPTSSTGRSGVLSGHGNSAPC